MHYFIIAGEASGDLHGAKLVEELRAIDHDACFDFLGGDKMATAVGHEPFIHNSDMAFMGFSEVLRHLDKILGNIKRTKCHIADLRPDCLILIDYPSFNLKMAKAANRLGIPVYYYISPKIWAWKEWRIKSIKRYVDRMFSILPFERQFYAKHDYKIDYVGNPSVEEIDKIKPTLDDRNTFLNKNKLRDRQLIALLPGSRTGEIRCNLPIMVHTVSQFPQYRAVIAGAPDIPDEIYERYSKLPIVRNTTYDLLTNSRAALVTSGTATLETALLGVPQVVLYRSNGSKLAYNIMRKLIKVDYVSLPNLIAGKEIIPELLLHKCTVDAVYEHLVPLLVDSEQRKSQLRGYDYMRQQLGNSTAAVTTARLIYDALKDKNE